MANQPTAGAFFNLNRRVYTKLWAGLGYSISFDYGWMKDDPDLGNYRFGQHIQNADLLIGFENFQLVYGFYYWKMYFQGEGTTRRTDNFGHATGFKFNIPIKERVKVAFSPKFNWNILSPGGKANVYKLKQSFSPMALNMGVTFTF